jgi:hypothetical protein
MASFIGAVQDLLCRQFIQSGRSQSVGESCRWLYFLSRVIRFSQGDEIVLKAMRSCFWPQRWWLPVLVTCELSPGKGSTQPGCTVDDDKSWNCLSRIAAIREVLSRWRAMLLLFLDRRGVQVSDSSPSKVTTVLTMLFGMRPGPLPVPNQALVELMHGKDKDPVH